MVRPIEARFICSVLQADQFPKTNLPEIAFIGRSNVGKSSLLNALLGSKGLAKTSGKPGKTQTINFFEVEKKRYFVDLPGYGYARVAKSVKEEWGRHMMAYLQDRVSLQLIVLLLDGRHEPMDNDLHILDLLEEIEKPTLIVTTKIDKVKRALRKKQQEITRQALGLDEDALIIAASSVTGEGLRDIWEVIRDL
ncbi:MAG: YihA family ribosome biogenesis GTP-binding protein [Candidatus Hydrogenedentes bacterium]|jgi:GTP-binding protein|nr:YihA family ribosome biogenesis GTP-binding protein [Candidatus Hydrogenedentota bacterium]